MAPLLVLLLLVAALLTPLGEGKEGRVVRIPVLMGAPRTSRTPGWVLRRDRAMEVTASTLMAVRVLRNKPCNRDKSRADGTRHYCTLPMNNFSH